MIKESLIHVHTMCVCLDRRVIMVSVCVCVLDRTSQNYASRSLAVATLLHDRARD